MFNVEIKEAFVTIDSNDSVFLMSDGITVAPRAGFSISNNCPQSVKHMVCNAIGKGWVMPIATMRESEYLIAKLTHNE